MILGLELTLFLYVLLAALFWFLRRFNENLALTAVVTGNATLIYIANPALFLYLVAQITLVRLLFELIRYKGLTRKTNLPWIAFIGLLPMNMRLFSDYWQAIAGVESSLVGYGMRGVFWYLGASFFVIKSFVILKEAVAEKRFSMLPALANLTFLPAFGAGPIYGSQAWRTKNLAPRFSFRTGWQIFLKIGWGAAAFYYLAPKLRLYAEQTSHQTLGFVPDMYLSLAALFFDFSGYSLLAIACGAMFGATLPENFNRPYLATSIREFWQRWHMSLSGFIGTYLFKPFVRVTGSQQKGIFLAFVFAGLWHKFTLGYLLWGIGHGAAMSLAAKPPKFWVFSMERMPWQIANALTWAFTITWVALLSYLATRSKI